MNEFLFEFELVVNERYFTWDFEGCQGLLV
jgi:hypothetical protein